MSKFFIIIFCIISIFLVGCGNSGNKNDLKVSDISSQTKQISATSVDNRKAIPKGFKPINVLNKVMYVPEEFKAIDASYQISAQATIREHLIKNLNVIDAIIGLPANLFHGTSIPTVCIVLKKKRNGNSSNILFIDASKEFKAGKKQNELLDENIDKIVNAYIERKDIEKYAHVASMEEIVKNEYNCNIPRYVDTSEEEEEIDISAVKAELADIIAKKQKAMDKVNGTMKLLGL